MEAISFVLISTEPMKEHRVYVELNKIKEILEISPLFDEYDFIVKIKPESFESLGEIVVSKIRTIDGVADTKTLSGIKINHYNK